MFTAFSFSSTTHEFLFGALAELVDNARYCIQVLGHATMTGVLSCVYSHCALTCEG